MGVWAILVGCIVGEVIAMSLLTKSEGFTQPLYGILSLVIYGGVIWVLSYVLTQLPMGVVYAVWSGMGIALTLHHWLGSSSATAHVGAGSVYCSDHRRRNRPGPVDPIVQPSTLISLWRSLAIRAAATTTRPLRS